MKSEQKFLDSPEFDEFFRQGDEPVHGPDTLQPVVGHLEDEESNHVPLRTPAQLERRAKFVKIVSATMAIMTVGSASAFAYEALQRHKPVVAAVRDAATRTAQNPHAEVQRADASARLLTENHAALATPAATGVSNLPEAVPAEASGIASAVAAKATNEPSIAPIASGIASAVAAKATNEKAPIRSSAPAQSRVTQPRVAQSRVTPPRVTQPRVTQPTGAKAGPKPEGYRPPTASFSD